MFNDLDETTADHYTLKKCEPNYYVHYHDGECVTLSSDMAVMKKEVERFEGKDGWVRFLKFMDEVCQESPCLNIPGKDALNSSSTDTCPLRSLSQGGSAQELPEHPICSQLALLAVRVSNAIGESR